MLTVTQMRTCRFSWFSGGLCESAISIFFSHICNAVQYCDIALLVQIWRILTSSLPIRLQMILKLCDNLAYSWLQDFPCLWYNHIFQLFIVFISSFSWGGSFSSNMLILFGIRLLKIFRIEITSNQDKMGIITNIYIYIYIYIL